MKCGTQPNNLHRNLVFVVMLLVKCELISFIRWFLFLFIDIHATRFVWSTQSACWVNIIFLRSNECVAVCYTEYIVQFRPTIQPITHTQRNNSSEELKTHLRQITNETEMTSSVCSLFNLQRMAFIVLPFEAFMDLEILSRRNNNAIANFIGLQFILLEKVIECFQAYLIKCGSPKASIINHRSWFGVFFLLLEIDSKSISIWSHFIFFRWIQMLASISKRVSNFDCKSGLEGIKRDSNR